MWRRNLKGTLATADGVRCQKLRALAPRQSAIGEINLPSTRGPKEFLTTRPAGSPDSVRNRQKKNVQLHSQSVIGEINLRPLFGDDAPVKMLTQQNGLRKQLRHWISAV